MKYKFPKHSIFAVSLCSCDMSTCGASTHQAARMLRKWNDSHNYQELPRTLKTSFQLNNQLSSLNSTFTTSKTTLILTWNTCQITLVHPLSSSSLSSVLSSLNVRLLWGKDPCRRLPGWSPDRIMREFIKKHLKVALGSYQGLLEVAQNKALGSQKRSRFGCSTL